jgi:hypothetical protein
MGTYGNFKNPQQLRDYARFNRPIPVIDGGWHYSFMGDANKIKEKVENIAESHYIIDLVGDVDKIQERLDTIQDLWDRTETYAQKKIVNVDRHGPKSINKFIEKYPSFYFNG